MLANYNLLVNERVLNTFNDDRTYLYLIHLNGYTLKPCTKWCVAAPTGSNVKMLEVTPKSDYKYKVGRAYDAQVAPVVAEICGAGR